MNSFLILAHRNPKGLLSLLKALCDQTVYVRIDKLSSKTEFKFINELNFPKLHILSETLRLNLHLGGISIFNEILNLFRGNSKNRDVDRVVFLIGLDYLVLPLSKVNVEFGSEENRDFLTAIKLSKVYRFFLTGETKYKCQDKKRFVVHQKFRPLRNENMQIKKKKISNIIKLLEIRPIRNAKFQKARIMGRVMRGILHNFCCDGKVARGTNFRFFEKSFCTRSAFLAPI